MSDHTNGKDSGFVLWHGLLLIVVIAVVSFIGGSVFTAQQKMQQDKAQAEAAADAKAAAALEVQKKSAAEKKERPIEVPAEAKKAEPAPAPAPVPAPVPKPVAAKPAPTVKPPKPEPTKVGITASSQVTADAVVLTASLPAVYSGTCKALVKHLDGSNHMWLEAGFASASSCSINVPRSSLTTAMEWQYYLYFNNSDWTVKGDSGKHTFAL